MIRLKLSGKVSSENAGHIEEEFFKAVGNEKSPEIQIDAEDLEYISSAGLRVLLELKKTAKSVLITGVNPQIMEVLEMTGFDSLLTVQRKTKEINVDGLEILGEGVTAVVYRLDDEKIVKLYREEYSEAEIRKEQETTRNAFLLGVPTMISYDIVKAGNRYGAVYEAFNFNTLESLYVKASAEERKQLIAKHADIVRKMSEITVESDSFVGFKEKTQKLLQEKRTQLTEEKFKVYQELIDAIPDDRYFVHGDCHMGNIMIDDAGRCYVIDLGICGYGNPVFLLASVCLYSVFADVMPAEEYQKTTKLTPEEGRLWSNDFIRAYFKETDEAMLENMKTDISVYGCIFSTLNYDFLPDEVFKKLSDYAVEHAKEDYDLFFETI